MPVFPPLYPLPKFERSVLRLYIFAFNTRPCLKCP